LGRLREIEVGVTCRVENSIHILKIIIIIIVVLQSLGQAGDVAAWMTKYHKRVKGFDHDAFSRDHLEASP
jgi:hypothetical protein